MNRTYEKTSSSFHLNSHTLGFIYRVRTTLHCTMNCTALYSFFFIFLSIFIIISVTKIQFFSQHFKWLSGKAVMQLLLVKQINNM